jgi:16S rRNA processing protein RimM
MGQIPEFIKVGYCIKTFGVKGGLRLAPEPGFEKLFEDERAFFFVIDGSMVPFLVQRREGEGESWDFFFKRIDSKEAATPFSDKDVFIEKREGLEIEAKPTTDLAGWVLVDSQSGKRGEVIRIEEYPEQTMMITRIDNEEHLVPLVDEWIERIDEDESTLYLLLPEGLI